MIRKEIQGLIALRREGDYWDFKKQPHSNSSDLLHDIICLANSPSRHAKYLIIGVSDPSDGCRVLGLESTTENRKRQSDLLDFLRGKKFAGDIRPSVSVSTIRIGGKAVDVLAIEDSPHKPYYLVEDTLGLKAFHIYTRVGDTNTPKTASADLYFTEKLWQQRFGLDLPPIDRFALLLDQHEMWNINVGNREFSHHRQFPEYQLRFCKTEVGWEPYSHYFPNPTTFFGKLHLMYFSTVLMEMGYCGLDEFRIPSVTPDVELVRIEKEEWLYYYFEADSVEWRVNRLLGAGWTRYLRPQYWPFAVFKDKAERVDFNAHLIRLGKALLSRAPSKTDKSIAKRILRDGKSGGIGPEFMGKTVRELWSWRNTKQ
jgi:hypothetical protein